MRLLLDTHVFIWTLTEPQNITDTARAAIEDPANDVFISAAVAWEIAIKHSIGRLTLPMDPAALVASRIALLGYRALPITLEHGLAVATLPKIHADPFDRILIAQAFVEDMSLVTYDATVLRYPIAFQR